MISKIKKYWEDHLEWCKIENEFTNGDKLLLWGVALAIVIL